MKTVFAADLHFCLSLDHYNKLASFMAIMDQAIRAIMTISPNYGYKGHYGQIIMAINEACLNYQINLEEKCRSAPKTVFKKLHWLKSYGQNNVRIAKMAISFVF